MGSEMCIRDSSPAPPNHISVTVNEHADVEAGVGDIFISLNPPSNENCSHSSPCEVGSISFKTCASNVVLGQLAERIVLEKIRNTLIEFSSRKKIPVIKFTGSADLRDAGRCDAKNNKNLTKVRAESLKLAVEKIDGYFDLLERYPEIELSLIHI